MTCYRDMSFCMRECGREDCLRNKQRMPWDNQLPVSFIRCSDCKNYKPYRTRTQKDYYEVK